MSVKDKLFIFGDPEGLKDRLRIVILAPVFAVIGVSLRFILFPTFENSELLNSVIYLVFVMGTMYIGFTLLELID
jgi:hypothetical protein